MMIVNAIWFIESGHCFLLFFRWNHLAMTTGVLKIFHREGGVFLKPQKVSHRTKTFISQNVFPWFVMLSSPAQTTGPWHLLLESHSQTVTLSIVTTSLENILICVVTPINGQDRIYDCFKLNPQNQIRQRGIFGLYLLQHRESIKQIKVQLKSINWWGSLKEIVP